MSEKYLLSLLMSDKTITNPINKTEIFLCSDLYSDYRKCKVLKRKGVRTTGDCHEIRKLGQQCYLQTEEEFEKMLARMFEDKKKYITYLKNEGSILYQHYKSDPTVFSVKRILDENELSEHVNEYISS
jgi:hypothetical protein